MGGLAGGERGADKISRAGANSAHSLRDTVGEGAEDDLYTKGQDDVGRLSRG